MRDAAGTCIAVCSMENVDPLGVHTGDSIVVAPVQTLSDQTHQRLRARRWHHPRAGRRGRLQRPVRAVARSRRLRGDRGQSARLAFVGAGVEGDRLPDRPRRGPDRRRATTRRDPNAVTGKTVAAFEPALDYVVVKLPRFPFDKFPGAERGLGSQMKATGEVMAIERNFGAALNKALRGMEQGGAGWLSEDADWTTELEALSGDLSGVADSRGTVARSFWRRPTRACGD